MTSVPEPQVEWEPSAEVADMANWQEPPDMPAAQQERLLNTLDLSEPELEL